MWPKLLSSHRVYLVCLLQPVHYSLNLLNYYIIIDVTYRLTFIDGECTTTQRQVVR